VVMQNSLFLRYNKIKENHGPDLVDSAEPVICHICKCIFATDSMVYESSTETLPTTCKKCSKDSGSDKENHANDSGGNENDHTNKSDRDKENHANDSGGNENDHTNNSGNDKDNYTNDSGSDEEDHDIVTPPGARRDRGWRTGEWVEFKWP